MAKSGPKQSPKQNSPSRLQRFGPPPIKRAALPPDRRPALYYNMNLGPTPQEFPFYGFRYTDYDTFYSDFTGTGNLSPLSGSGSRHVFQRLMFWQPRGQLSSNPIGSFAAAPYKCNEDWVRKGYKDIIAYIKARVPSYSFDVHAGVAVSNSFPDTRMVGDRLMNDTDTWVKDSLDSYRLDGFNGAWFIDAGHADASKTNATSALKRFVNHPIDWRIGTEAIARLGSSPNFTPDIDEIRRGPQWSDYQNWMANYEGQGGENWVVPNSTLDHEIIIICLNGIASDGIPGRPAHLARMIRLIQQGFVLGAGDPGDLGGLPSGWVIELVLEAYAKA